MTYNGCWDSNVGSIWYCNLKIFLWYCSIWYCENNWAPRTPILLLVISIVLYYILHICCLFLVACLFKCLSISCVLVCLLVCLMVFCVCPPKKGNYIYIYSFKMTGDFCCLCLVSQSHIESFCVIWFFFTSIYS